MLIESGTLIAQLEEKIQYWGDCTVDPHNVATAAYPGIEVKWVLVGMRPTRDGAEKLLHGYRLHSKAQIIALEGN